MPITFDIEIETDEFYLIGEAKGKVEGEAKGEAKAIDVIKHWQKGMEPLMIANVLDLPIKQVEHIIAQFQAPWKMSGHKINAFVFQLKCLVWIIKQGVLIGINTEGYKKNVFSTDMGKKDIFNS